MNDLINAICTIINASTAIVGATVKVISCVREGKRRRRNEKTGKHYRSE